MTSRKDLNNHNEYGEKDDNIKATRTVSPTSLEKLKISKENYPVNETQNFLKIEIEET